jgi:hypothetical protein
MGMEGEVGMGQWVVSRRDGDPDGPGATGPAGNGANGRPPRSTDDPGADQALELRAQELRGELAETVRELETRRAEQRVQQRLVALMAEEDPSAAPVRAEGPAAGVLVPLSAWQRMLDQLGNLHEAGQLLAEARERAAKAETQNEFLRERVRDLRGELERLQAEASTPLPPRAEPPGWRRFWRR